MSSDVTAYYFWSPTCGPCKTIKPSMEVLHEEFPEVNWVAVNTHQDTNGYTAKFQVSVVPTLVVLKKDVEIGRHSGSTLGIYYTLIRKALKA